MKNGRTIFEFYEQNLNLMNIFKNYINKFGGWWIFLIQRTNLEFLWIVLKSDEQKNACVFEKKIRKKVKSTQFHKNAYQFEKCLEIYKMFNDFNKCS